MAKRTLLADKLKDVRDRIAEACARARRQPSEVTLIAVTKYAAPEQVREIMQLGVADLGESRVQQLVQRAVQLNEFHQRRLQHGDLPGLPERLRWHMIGHLQRNKVKQLLPHVNVVHSIDSLRLAEELDAQMARQGGRRLPVLLQVNASEEPQKYGVAVGAAVHLAEQIDSMPNLQLVGLMTLAPLADDKEIARRVFDRTREVFEEMRWHKIGKEGLRHLSMGMSNDYEAAVEAGATLLRLGSVLFGGRPEGAEEDEE